MLMYYLYNYICAGEIDNNINSREHCEQIEKLTTYNVFRSIRLLVSSMIMQGADNYKKL